MEHVEVEEGGLQSIYKPLIAAGLAFGATRWVAILDGYCQRATTGAHYLGEINLIMLHFHVSDARKSN